MQYTELDAFYDILVWQFPIPCALASCFVVSFMAQEMVAGKCSWLCCPVPPAVGQYPTLIFLACAWSLYVAAWFAVAIPILLLDICVIPPVFAFIRYSKAAGMRIA